MFNLEENTGNKTVDQILTEMETKEAESLRVLEESNVKFKVQRAIVLKRAMARRAILMAKANSDPMFNRYEAVFSQLREIRAKIIQKYGNKANMETRKNLGM